MLDRIISSIFPCACVAELTLGSMTTSLSGMSDDPTLSSPMYKRSDGDGASDRWKLHSERKESCRTDSALPDAAFAFDPNIMHPQSIFKVSFETMMLYIKRAQSVHIDSGNIQIHYRHSRSPARSEAYNGPQIPSCGVRGRMLLIHAHKKEMRWTR